MNQNSIPFPFIVSLSQYRLNELQMTNLAVEWMGKVMEIEGGSPEELHIKFTEPHHLEGFKYSLLCFVKS